MTTLKIPSTLKNILLYLLLNLSISQAEAQYKSFDISEYSYAQFSTSGEASVDLFDDKQKLVGILIFLPVEPNLLPPATEDPNDGLIRLYYTTSNLSSVIDVLRNESPIVLNYWQPSGNNSHIGTRKLEWVGEGE